MTAPKKPSTEPSTEEKTSYQVQWLLSHDGNDYQAGDVIDLPDNEAAPLLVGGVIQLVGDKNEH